MPEHLLLAKVSGCLLGSRQRVKVPEPIAPEPTQNTDERPVEVLAVVDETLARIQPTEPIHDGTAEVQLYRR